MENRVSSLSDLSSSSECDVTTSSGVAWAAILGGAVAAAGLTLVLSPLGTALGFAWASPWNHMGEFDKTFTIASAIWLIVVQWLSSGFGGYLTGRLRTKWTGAHTHEVFFRDTVHGFLAWALAAVIGAVLLASLASHMAGKATPQNDSSSYLSDTLFRNVTSPSPAGVSDYDRAESRRIIAKGVADGHLSETDKNYLTELVVSRTGVSVTEADARINAVLSQQETMIKNVAKASFFICLSLLIGAFIASAAGALGGIHRDVHYEHGRLSL